MEQPRRQTKGNYLRKQPHYIPPLRLIYQLGSTSDLLACAFFFFFFFASILVIIRGQRTA